jgi:hypothetical protein
MMLVEIVAKGMTKRRSEHFLRLVGGDGEERRRRVRRASA